MRLERALILFLKARLKSDHQNKLLFFLVSGRLFTRSEIFIHIFLIFDFCFPLNKTPHLHKINV